MAEESGFDKDEAIFLSIMYSFHAAAMQHMGKIANPFTGKVERDLDAARGTIDVLLMFKKKTEGNLSDRELRTLNNLITELQLNYVEEAKREPAAAEGEEAPPKEEAAAAKGAGEAPPAEEPAVTPPPAEEAAAEEAPAEEAAAEPETKETGEKEAEAGAEEKKKAQKKTAPKGGRKKKKKE
jgi:uncharacterized membrane protein